MESVAFLLHENFSQGEWLHSEVHLLENPVPTKNGPNCTHGHYHVLTKHLTP